MSTFGNTTHLSVQSMGSHCNHTIVLTNKPAYPNPIGFIHNDLDIPKSGGRAPWTPMAFMQYILFIPYMASNYFFQHLEHLISSNVKLL